MDQGLTWYRRRPRAFLDGVQGMGPELIGAYAVLLDLFYARGGLSLRDDRHLGGVLGCSTRKAKNLTDALLERGKVVVRGRFITNSVAEKEARSSRITRESQASGGREGAEKRWHDKENNDLPMGGPIDDPSLEKRREEKKTDDDARTRTRDESIFDEIVKAAKADVSKSAWLDFNVSAALLRWRALDLTDAEIMTTIRAVVGKRRDPSPVGSPAYFDNEMQLAAGQKHQPDLTPIDGGKGAQIPIPRVDIEKILKKRRPPGG